MQRSLRLAGAFGAVLAQLGGASAFRLTQGRLAGWPQLLAIAASLRLRGLWTVNEPAKQIR
jgi:hypothetical protein